jgi:hypothetical protein
MYLCCLVCHVGCFYEDDLGKEKVGKWYCGNNIILNGMVDASFQIMKNEKERLGEEEVENSKLKNKSHKSEKKRKSDDGDENYMFKLSKKQFFLEKDKFDQNSFLYSLFPENCFSNSLKNSSTKSGLLLNPIHFLILFFLLQVNLHTVRHYIELFFSSFLLFFNNIHTDNCFNDKYPIYYTPFIKSILIILQNPKMNIQSLASALKMFFFFTSPFIFFLFFFFLKFKCYMCAEIWRNY